MSGRNIRTIAVYAVVLIVTVLVAYALGVTGARWVTNRRAQAKRAELTAAILQQMGGTITIGKPLPNARFEGLDGTARDLQSMISANTIVVFLDAECHYCLDEIQTICRVFKEDGHTPPVVFISDANLDELRALRDQYEILVPIFHDPDGSYAISLAVTTFPFNVVVDKTLSVRDVIAGPIPADMVRKVSASNE